MIRVSCYSKQGSALPLMREAVLTASERGMERRHLPGRVSSARLTAGPVASGCARQKLSAPPTPTHHGASWVSAFCPEWPDNRTDSLPIQSEQMFWVRLPKRMDSGPTFRG